jgi:peroxiredoxin
VTHISRIAVSSAPKHDNIYELPPGLPVPVDDGACAHLPGMQMPSVKLHTTSESAIDVAQVSKPKAVFFFFPAAGRPGVPSPPGWNDIPGARGCTPQICSFRDSTSGFQELGFRIFGISAQRLDDLKEIAQRNKIQYDLLSDFALTLTKELQLPTFGIEPSAPIFPRTCIKRLTLVAEAGRIRKVFYPVFPSDKNAGEVLTYLRTGAAGRPPYVIK